MGACLPVLGSSAVLAYGLQQDVELQRLSHLLPPLLQLVAHGEQLLRLEVELDGAVRYECGVGAVRCGATLPSWCGPLPAVRRPRRRGSC